MAAALVIYGGVGEIASDSKIPGLRMLVDAGLERLAVSDIEDPAQVQYPVKQPTGGQLATRADRETARINAALTEERDQAKDDAASARTLAIIGLVVGVLGLAAGGVALARGRRTPASPAPAADDRSATARNR